MRFLTKKARGVSRARSNSRAGKEKSSMWLNPEEIYCRVCSKRFNKVRALCGHMRAHGDRPWRGLLPTTDHHPRFRPRPPTYEASTSTGTLPTTDHHPRFRPRPPTRDSPTRPGVRRGSTNRLVGAKPWILW